MLKKLHNIILNSTSYCKENFSVNDGSKLNLNKKTDATNALNKSTLITLSRYYGENFGITISITAKFLGPKLKGVTQKKYKC